MAEEIDFENGRISNFQRHVTLTLDRAIWHTIVHHSLTSTEFVPYTPNFIRIGETLRMDGRTDICTYAVRTDGQTSRPALLGLPVDLKNTARNNVQKIQC